MSHHSKTALPGARATVDAEVCLLYTMQGFNVLLIVLCFCCCVPIGVVLQVGTGACVLRQRMAISRIWHIE